MNSKGSEATLESLVTALKIAATNWCAKDRIGSNTDEEDIALEQALINGCWMPALDAIERIKPDLVGSFDNPNMPCCIGVQVFLESGIILNLPVNDL